MNTKQIEELKGYGLTPAEILIWQVFKGEKWVKEKLKELELHKVYGNCATCGKPLTRAATPQRTKFCSEKCRDDYQYRDRKITVTCHNCGKVYHPAKNWKQYSVRGRRYCSKKCFYTDLRKRKLERIFLGSSNAKKRGSG